MNEISPETRTVVIEREVPHSPEKVWRALTQSHLMEEWLMKNDFSPVVGHRFSFSADWGAVECQVLAVETNEMLSYNWGDHDLKSTVTWTLTRTKAGTQLRMEQSGFRPDQPRYYHGAQNGWPKFLKNLEQLLARVD